MPSKNGYGMSQRKASGKGGMNMDAKMSDPIKDSLARPNMGAKPSNTHATVPRGKDFMPKGMKRK